MNYFDLISSYPDHTITAAWDSQVKEAAQTPGLAEILLPHGSELFPRFAACYAELRALPRSARRALQRQIARSSDLTACFPEWLQSGGGRELQHKLARSLAGAALLLALGQGMAEAATITVTAKARPRVNSADGQCSLIEAIANANADAALFPDCAAGSGADTIVLPANATVTINTKYDYVYGPNGLPLITSPITIEGNNAKIVRSALAPPFRLLAVSTSGDLTLKNVTLRGGSSGYGGGGAVFNNGTLTIQNSTISGNSASRGGGVSNHGALAIENSTITGNDAGTGGGVSNGGFVYSANSTNSQNSHKSGPYCFGGYYYGIYCYYLYSGALTIANSTVSKNSASTGGGVSNYSGTVSIANSTISGNSGYWGGGAFNRGGSHDYYGKYIAAGTLSIANSTISKNSAAGVFYYGTNYGGAGGGVSNYGTLTLNRSLVSGNMAAHGREINSTATVTADNFNLFGANGDPRVVGFTPGLTDIVPARGVRVRKILERLKDNGGPTKTHALKPGSPALDVIPFTDPSCAGKDQRGVNRPQGTGCDIGAVEREGP